MKINFSISLSTVVLVASSLAAQNSRYHTVVINAGHGQWQENPKTTTDIKKRGPRHSVSNGFGECGRADSGAHVSGGGFAWVWSKAEDVCIGIGPLAAASSGVAKEDTVYKDSFTYRPGRVYEGQALGVAACDGKASADTTASLGASDATTVAEVRWDVTIQPLLMNVKAKARSAGTNSSSSGTSVTVGAVTVQVPYHGAGPIAPDSGSADFLRNPVDTNNVSRIIICGVLGYSFADGGIFGAAECESEGTGRCTTKVILTDRIG